MNNSTTIPSRPSWAWRKNPIALAGGEFPMTVLSHLYGAVMTMNKVPNSGILGFLTIKDLSNFSQVCEETSDTVLMMERVKKQIEKYKIWLFEHDDFVKDKWQWSQDDYDEFKRLDRKITSLDDDPLMKIALKEYIKEEETDRINDEF
jgi:hypothetical protein